MTAPSWRNCFQYEYQIRNDAVRLIRTTCDPIQRALWAAYTDEHHHMEHWVTLLAIANSSSSSDSCIEKRPADFQKKGQGRWQRSQSPRGQQPIANPKAKAQVFSHFGPATARFTRSINTAAEGQRERQGQRRWQERQEQRSLLEDRRASGNGRSLSLPLPRRCSSLSEWRVLCASEAQTVPGLTLPSCPCVEAVALQACLMLTAVASSTPPQQQSDRLKVDRFWLQGTRILHRLRSGRNYPMGLRSSSVRVKAVGSVGVVESAVLTLPSTLVKPVSPVCRFLVMSMAETDGADVVQA